MDSLLISSNLVFFFRILFIYVVTDHKIRADRSTSVALVSVDVCFLLGMAMIFDSAIRWFSCLYLIDPDEVGINNCCLPVENCSIR